MLADLHARQQISRRAALRRRLGGAGLILSPLGAMAAVGCGEAVDGEAIFSGGTTASSCTVIPTETGGPYPGDGTNGPNVLTQSGIVRSDMRSSFGASGSNVAAGVAHANDPAGQHQQQLRIARRLCNLPVALHGQRPLFNVLKRRDGEKLPA